MVSKAQANHIVGRLSGVTEEDSRVTAALKAIQVMRDAGMSPRAIAKAERMVEDARRRGVS